MNNIPIPWTKQARYLGVILDSHLTWKPHIKHVLTKFRARKLTLAPLIARDSALSLDNKILLYKAMLRPIMTYASPVWGYVCHTHLNKLQVQQNAFLRQATRCRWFIRNEALHRELNVPTLNDYIKHLMKRFIKRIP
ncbi:putative RNA-directed DNA polymerase from transposon X-element, partial [Stegodyphus mimosarum]